MNYGVTMRDGCLLDTSFFLRLLKENDPLFKNADDYFRYLLENKFPLFISTISIAEFCVKGSVDELPLKNLFVVPFNFEHAKRAGTLARILYNKRNKGQLKLNERPIIINDAKLFAQADTEQKIKYYITADKRSLKIYNSIKLENDLYFEFIHIETGYNEVFGVLDL